MVLWATAASGWIASAWIFPFLAKISPEFNRVIRGCVHKNITGAIRKTAR
jgi:hypothetical protein